MRVLHILNELRPSGAETMLRSAAAFWIARGIEGEILVTGESIGEYAEALRESGYKLHHVPFVKSRAFFGSVYRLIRAGQFDGVHIHCERANFWYAAAAFAAGNRNITRSVHSTFGFRGALRVARAGERAVLRHVLAARTVAVGPAVERMEWDRFRNRATVIPNWFDSVRFRAASPGERQSARDALGLAPGVLVVITVGNCSEVKNHQAVIRALALIPDDAAVTYLHVGSETHGDDRRLAGELKVARRIRFLGPAFDVSPYLRAADLFIMPSLHEGLGIAAVEAMGSGLPVLLADVEGLRDLSRIAPGAELVAPEPGPIAEAILRFQKIPGSKRRAIGRCLSDAAHARFAIEGGAAEYASLYAAGGPK